MPVAEAEPTRVKLGELVDAYEFVSADQLEEYGVYICRRTGQIIYVSGGVDMADDTPFPEDPEPADYQPVPHRRDFDLGKRMALSFVAEHLPGKLDTAWDIFARKGAYRRFRQLLHETDTLDKWYAFEARSTRMALAEWCDANGVMLIENDEPG